ncbi:hypothetical protein IscW_ISCW013940 [Ixodes scapularis]|uniref:Uncharacterized protein n=1 Tax=Ixodes scapularis TaxID=6945 RepID=B7QKZ2_IXOSC|nr:hypothetical protein IscW_ISCW013940 [Ixodes scapularis]|eukprot:XP_002415847.1 hypothetical protein IscW_ISCW013940 [Ixodes scapularis]
MSVAIFVTAALAVGAWLVYRKVTFVSSKRFIELRMDETDPIIADFTDEVMSGIPEAPATNLKRNLSEDPDLVGAWRRGLNGY